MLNVLEGEGRMKEAFDEPNSFIFLRDAFKKNSKIWDIGPKGGRGSSLNPDFLSYFNWDK